MSEPASPKKISEKPPAIQVSLMTGIKNPTEPPKPKESELVADQNNDLLSILRSTNISTLTSSFREKYNISNDSLTSILDNAKNHLTEGIQYVTPLPGKVASALETPLNNAIQLGQNFFSEVGPSVTGIKDYFRSALVTTIHWLDSALVILRNQLAHISASIEDAPKDSKNSEKDSGGKWKNS